MTGAGATRGALPWPLVARPELLAALEAGLAAEPGILHLIEGDAGVGKSELARAVATRRAAPELRVVGRAERVATPLAAFDEALAELGIDIADDSTLGSVVAVVGPRLAGRLVVADDAPRLDDASADVLRRLVTGFGASVVGTARSDEALPSPLRRLDADGLVRRHRVGGLSPADATALLAEVFRVPVRDDDVRDLLGVTRGNPLHLRVLVEEAVGAGRVLHRGDRVEFVGTAEASDLREALAGRLDALSTAARELLALVAHTQPVPRAAVRAAADREAALAELEGGGLVVRDPSGRLRVGHPLIADLAVVAAEKRVRVEAVRLLRASGDATRRFAAVQLEQGAQLPTPVSELVWAARSAAARGELATAATLADAAIAQPAPRADTVVALLTAASSRSERGDLDAADALFARADELARDPAERAALASARGDHLAYRRGDPAGAVDQGERERGALRDPAAVALDADLWRWRLTLSRAATATGADGAVGLVEAAISASVAASMRGEAAAAAAAAAPLLVPGAQLGALAGQSAIAVGLQRFVELRAAGRADEAAAFVDLARADAGDEVGFFTVLLAMHRLREGRLAEARAAASLAIEQLRRWDGGELLSLALATRATALAQAGERAEAAALLRDLDAREVSGAAVLQRAECEAHVLAAEGRHPAATDLVLSVVGDALASGYRFLGGLTLSLAVRLGDVDRSLALAERLCAEIAEPVEHCLALRDLLAARQSGRVDRVLPAAARVARAGLAPVAIDALTLTSAGAEPAEARRALSAARTLAAGVDAPPMQHLGGVALSSRELEVARAAASRMRSREIAERLGISARTVENQLYSVYRKLGVASRDDLEEALREAGLA